MAVYSPDRVIIEYAPKERYTAVRMTNDCMKGAGITVGSIMIVRFQREMEDGDIILFARDLRRVRKMGDMVLLMSENPEYDVMTPEEGDFVIGKVVEVKTYFGRTA